MHHAEWFDKALKSVRPQTSHVMKEPDPDSTATPLNRSFLMYSPERMGESNVLSPRCQH